MRVHPHPWLALASAIAFLHIGLLTFRRSFPLSSGLRFVGLGMAAMSGLNFPAQLLAQWMSGCNQSRTLDACIHLSVFPDPLVEEVVRVAMLAAGVLLVRRHRSAHLSDLVFWVVCLSIGMYFVEETLRYGRAVLAGADQRYLLTGQSLLERSHAWHFPLTLLPGGFVHVTFGLAGTQGASGPEFGWFLTGVVASVGLWLLLRRGWWRVAGVPVLALGIAWSAFDHAMYNLYLSKAQFFGVVVDALAPRGGAPAFWREHLAQGHLLRYAFAGALVLGFVSDEIAYCRVGGQRPGGRLASELARIWVYARARRLGLAIRVNQLERRADALVVAPSATVDEAAAAMRERMLYQLVSADRLRPPWWRRVLGLVAGARVPPLAWLKLSVRLLTLSLGVALLAAVSIGRVGSLRFVRQPGLLWLTLVLLAIGVGLALLDAAQAARQGDGLPLLLVALSAVSIGLFRVLPAVGHALWNVPGIQLHFIEVARAFLQGLLSPLGLDQLGHLLTTLGFAIAGVALALGAAARWWSDNVTPQWESSWVLGALLVLALLAPLLLPVLLPAELAFLAPLIVWGSRAVLLADSLTRLAPDIVDAADAAGYELQSRSYEAVGDHTRAAAASSRAGAAWSRLAAQAPSAALRLGLDLVSFRTGGHALHLLGGHLDQALANRVERLGFQRTKRQEAMDPRRVGGGSGPPPGESGDWRPDDPMGRYRNHPPLPQQWSGSKLFLEDPQEGQTFGTQHMAGTVERLSDRQVEALRSYAGINSRDINQALRWAGRHRSLPAGGFATASWTSIRPSTPPIPLTRTSSSRDRSP